MVEPQIITELRCRIHAKFNLHSITPADCKHIASQIRLMIKKNISETTIKRLYGFAHAKHRFSQYTLSVLAEFNAELQKQSIADCWKKVMAKTTEITNQ